MRMHGDALKKATAIAKTSEAKSLLVLEEGQRMSPDLLVFHGQLEDLLHRDSGLWCVSAWNDYGLAPFVADPTVVLRSDWFSAVAWMTSLAFLESEILPKWQEDNWAQHLRLTVRSKRGSPTDAWWFAVLVSRGLSCCAGQRRSILASTPVCSKPSVDLGDVARLKENNYLRLLVFDWPLEGGLFYAKPLASLRPLADGRTNSEGPFSLIVPIRSMFQGVLRLRWRDSILYLVASSSPLLRGEGFGVSSSELMRLASRIRASAPIDPMQLGAVRPDRLFYGFTAPFLRPPGGEVRPTLQLGCPRG
eukprot:g28483.t1